MEPLFDTRPVLADDEEGPRPLTDRDHLSTYGWAWDDPNTTEDPT